MKIKIGPRVYLNLECGLIAPKSDTLIIGCKNCLHISKFEIVSWAASRFLKGQGLVLYYENPIRLYLQLIDSVARQNHHPFIKG